MLKSGISFDRSASLLKYAAQDSSASGIPLPKDISNVEELTSFMSRAGEVLFLPGDPNFDNQKRNIAIQVFLKFQPDQIVDFCKNWLDKWTCNSTALWYQEWMAIVERADPYEFEDILLSHHEQRVRQRLSSPMGEMFDFETILRIKRTTQHEAV
jgi:hypothetical protein